MKRIITISIFLTLCAPFANAFLFLIVPPAPIQTPSASFSTPATTYAVGNLVTNSIVASSVVPMSWPVSSPNGIYIRRANLSVSNITLTGAWFRLHLYKSAPIASNGNGAAWLSTRAGHFCDLDLMANEVFSDGVRASGQPSIGDECNVATVPIIYGLLEARQVYTATAGQTFTTGLEIEQ